jgi:phosphate transport system substrate-binding protein
MAEIGARFETLHPGVKIDVAPGGSAKALVDLRSGASDIAMLPRGLRSTDHDLFAFPIARDGIAVIVNRDNPVRELNSAQLTSVLTGRISNWKALAPLDAPIQLGLRDQPEGSADMVLQHLKLQPTQVTPHASINATSDAISFVANGRNRMALASIGEAERSARNGVAIKLLGYEGFPATSRTIHNHLYGLTRAMSLITRRPPEGLQKQFLEYATSTAVLDLLLKYGFVPYEQ